SADQVEWIVRDSGARHVVTETAAHTATVTSGTAAHPGQPRVWELDAGALADLTALGRGVSDEEVTKRRTALTPDSVATVCYTSGTTGRP
ncbi:AMP-binding protein, partial [Streptomyces sp. SID6648]|nr:AMP-binding protein [Streptomyces sp. SID6648]